MIALPRASQTTGQYVLAWFVCLAFGFARHAIARLRADLVAANVGPATPARIVASGGGKTSALLADTDDGATHGINGGSSAAHGHVHSYLTIGFLRRNYAALRLVDMLLFAVVATVGFLNMLLVMSYNPGIMMAIVAGEAIGVLALEPPGGLLHAVGAGGDATGHNCH